MIVMMMVSRPMLPGVLLFIFALLCTQMSRLLEVEDKKQTRTACFQIRGSIRSIHGISQEA